MTERPAATARPCAVPDCTGTSVDPGHTVNAAPAAGLAHPVPLCPDHWRAVDAGAEWLATERPGDRVTRGVAVLLGDELVGRGLVVADRAGVGWRRGGFSAPLAPDRNLGVLAVEGRVYGSTERVHVELVLTPDAVAQLRSVLRLYPETADPR